MTPGALQVVAVCHRLEPGAFVRALVALGRREGRELAGVVVDNRRRSAQVDPSFELLAGSNRQLDFSGYFEGLDHLLRGRAPPASVWFVNDTLFSAHSAAAIGHRLLAAEPLLRQIRLPAMAGKRDPYRSICLRNPWSGHNGYLSSFCVVLNALALPAMQALPVDAQAHGVLADVPVDDDRWGQSIAPELREMIRAHLVYGASPLRWASADGASPSLVQAKAQCVYFEQRLSGAIGAIGSLLPINAGPRAASAIAVAEFLSRARRRWLPASTDQGMPAA
jgi:hypothetical protein